MLSKHKNYMPVFVSEKRFSGVYILQAGNPAHLTVFETNDDDRDYVSTEITDELYDFITAQKMKCDRLGISLKERMHVVKDYVKFVEDSMVFDRGQSYYSEGAVCFSCLDAEMIIEMFGEIGYFGFPEDHPYVKQLIATYRKRAKEFGDNEEAGKRMLFDISHMEKMMKSGLSVNHVEHFKPLSKKRMREYFGGLIETAKNEPNKLDFRFLKNITVRYSYVYAVDNMFHTYYPTNEYTQGFSMMLDNGAVNEIMTDFSEYVWNNMTYPAKESIQILEQMMGKYL